MEERKRLPAIEDALLQLHESPTVDYKEAFAWNEKDKEQACEIVKDLIAFANSAGGFIFIGVKELPDHSFEHTGMSDEQLHTWEQTRVANFAERHVQPRLSFTMRTYPYNEMRFVVIQVQPFTDLPHLCVRECTGVVREITLYVRNEKNESAPVRTPDDVSRIIERALRNRSDRLLESVHTILRGADITPVVRDKEQFRQQLSEIEL